MTINIRVQTSPSKDAIDLEGKIDTSKREDIEHLVDSFDINLIKKEN